MIVSEAKQIAAEWVRLNAGDWPGFRAAHLVGGITAMPENAAFAVHKDVDVHLIFDDDSPMLKTGGPFPAVLEESFRDVPIEAGLKPVAEYASAEAVLANPEIAFHLTVDSDLYDPDGLLRDLHGGVVAGYARRQWVCARLDHERRGFAGALGMTEMVSRAYGAAGEVALLGYPMTFMTGALQVARLEPPRMGGQTLVRLREALAAHHRLDDYETLLDILGLAAVPPDEIERRLAEGAEAFDLAVRVMCAPHPFGHKLRPHLRDYFVESCRAMIAGGNHREALGWLAPYYVSTAGVILAEGPESAKPRTAARLDAFLRLLGMASADERVARFGRMRAFGTEMFALADQIVGANPGVRD